MVTHSYSSKILLFGEYSVLLGSKALAFPFAPYQGHWQWIHACADEKISQAKASNEALQQLLAYLTATLPSSLLENAFNLKQLNDDCNDGIYFQSNIPIGYGIGSSGALTAAVFHRYVHHANRNSSVALTELQQQLAYIESFFHQPSSGVDPLVSFCNQPLLLHQNSIELLAPLNMRNILVFIIDTHIKRTSKTLINEFIEKSKHHNVAQIFKNELIPLTTQCIETFLDDDAMLFFDKLKQLSTFQYQHFNTLIPLSFQQLWKDGLHSNNFYLKLCGAGAGGFLLGFCQRQHKHLVPNAMWLIE